MRSKSICKDHSKQDAIGRRDTMPQLYSYTYDQLNRITGMNVHRELDTENNLWTSRVSNIVDDYKERVSYDGNGNILTYLRNGHEEGGLEMDNLTYEYYAGTNRLRHVKDQVSD